MAVKREIIFGEQIIYAVIWSLAVLYSIYCFTIESNEYFRFYKDEYADFSQSWFIYRRKDAGDQEWRVMKFLIRRISPWIVLSTIVSEFLRTFKLFKGLQIWQILITTFFVVMELGIIPFTMLIIQPILFSVLVRKRSKSLIWLCSISSLLLQFTCHKYITRPGFFPGIKLSEQLAHLSFIAVAWLNLKCTSYCLDYIEEKRKQQQLVEFLSYCLYLPNIISGPFISYNNFKGCYQRCGDTQKRIFQLFKDVLRVSFWLLFTEFCLHFVYVNAVGFHPEWIKSFNSWAFYGYGYTMGQFFHLKYIVMYGLATSFAKFENVKVPPLPVCIGRIHLYSDMWKYFDAGLYDFMLRYIYIPLMNVSFIKNRLVSSLICFIFVFIWHGCHYFIMVWSFLNYIGIVMEYFAKCINEKYVENSKMAKKLGPIWLRRLSCAAASPLLTMSAISNFHLFAGTEIGYLFAQRVLFDGIQPTLVLLAILYTCCQVSTQIKHNRNSKKSDE